jgi:hypothetical protein
MSEKITGYLLLLIGLIIIGLSSLNVYQVFTKQIQPVNVFLFDSIRLDFAKFIPEAPVNTDLTQELVPSDVLNLPMNYAAHLMLMGFLASSGYKIASIGVTLLRPIKVKLKEELKNPEKGNL